MKVTLVERLKTLEQTPDPADLARQLADALREMHHADFAEDMTDAEYDEMYSTLHNRITLVGSRE